MREGLLGGRPRGSRQSTPATRPPRRETATGGRRIRHPDPSRRAVPPDDGPRGSWRVPMNAFIVDLEDRPGSIAAVAEALAIKGISITSLAGIASRGAGSTAILTNDEAGTRKALADGRFSVREVEVVPHTIEDRPGSFAEVARKLADAGINLDAVLPTGMSRRQGLDRLRHQGRGQGPRGPRRHGGGRPLSQARAAARSLALPVATRRSCPGCPWRVRAAGRAPDGTTAGQASRPASRRSRRPRTRRAARPTARDRRRGRTR